MMKIISLKSILLLFILGIIMNIKGQELVNEKIYSQSVNDSVEIKIWLPENYDSERSYPVIYEFVYDHSNYIAATVNNLYECPAALVVHASFYPGTSYEKPTLSTEGEKYYQFVKDELLLYIEAKYKTLHRTAAGLSQGADYVNYILRTNPELFDAYMIYAIESPYYEVNFSDYIHRLKEKKDYYIAIANDTERRVEFARTLYDHLSKNEYLNVLKQEFKRADHSYCMLYSLAEGLKFTYKDYYSFRKQEEEETFSEYFSHIENEIREKYGAVNYYGLLNGTFEQLTKESSKAEVNMLLEKLYQDKTNIHDMDLFNLGYMLSEQLGFYDLAEATFKESIERGKKLSVQERKMQLSSTYTWLAKVCYEQGAHDRIFSTLQSGFEATGSKKLLRVYAIYSFRKGDKTQIKKGIEALNTLVALPKSEDSFNNPDQPQDAIYFLYAKGYWKLNDKKKSRKYLKMCLEVNPEYKAALEFQETME